MSGIILRYSGCLTEIWRLHNHVESENLPHLGKLHLNGPPTGNYYLKAAMNTLVTGGMEACAQQGRVIEFKIHKRFKNSPSLSMVNRVGALHYKNI